jgi:hypothetical protein
MANTFELIASSTVGSGGAATISFSSIASTYTDLCLKLSARATGTGTAKSVLVSYNGSSSSFTSRFLEGNGSSAASYTSPAQFGGNFTGGGATASTFGNLELYIPNYAGSANKSASSDAVTENNATGAYSDLTASLWSNTAAITSITLTPEAGVTFAEFSTAYLYGVKNA